MKLATQIRNCSDCGDEFPVYDIRWEGRELFSQQRCDSCTEAAQKAHDDAEKAAFLERQKTAYAAICPPLYRDTEPSKLHPDFRKAVTNWQYGPRGLALIGAAGTGKTRAAYWLLRRISEVGRSIWTTNATTFAKLCVDKFADEKVYRTVVEREMQSIYRADLWLLDDLGKQRTTERVESDLYAVLEYRTARQLPTIWTSNIQSEDLEAMFSENQSESIMRRLIQFNEIVTVWENEVAIQNT